ncbi:MAG TPA: PQQ-binding-like beta-propeller repeat protein [Bryobacteraceae bacterium]|jgi:polyvinyl alcohol dehydrogenase (cytochrome)|nr:PQQ-binding-like beta-propeller repeat protein [Bryobacteraceae bacterium]
MCKPRDKLRLMVRPTSFAGKALASVVLGSLWAWFAQAQATSKRAGGETVYKQRCAGCHEQTNPRIPPRSTLVQMPAARILRALDFGAMMTVAYPLSRDQREAVATYLGTDAPAIAFPPSAYCSDRRVTVSDRPKSAWNGWSASGNNARYQSTEAAGLHIDQVHGLKLKWAFGFDGDVTAFAQPTVIDGQVFVGSAGGVIHAMRAETGCLQWTFQANGPVRSSVLAVPVGAKHALLFGDQTGWFYSVEAESGKLLWKKRVEEHDAARLTGAPVAYNGNVFVPVASWEETRSLDPNYACCTFRGSVVALRIGDGQQAWKTYLVPEPQETGKTKRGTPKFGPSGVGVWASPTLDTKRGLMYIATGDNYSTPPTSLSDALVALEIRTGRIVWSKQTTPGDAYNSSCGTDKQNCPEENGPDYDFGSSAILTKLPDGRDVLVAGQKSGMVYAFDPEKAGGILWQVRIASRAANMGPSVGVQWGMASDGQRVYAAASASGRTRPTDPLDTRRNILDPHQGGGLAALRIADGSTAWSAPPIVCAAGAPSGCSPAQSAAVTGIPGVVFSASMDGHVRGYNAEDGTVIWDFDTAREFQTVNGIKAKGGSIDGPGVVVANGMVFINSGYSRFGGMPGNVLLAFAP